MKQFIISEGLRNELLQYLGTRPLQEVMKGFLALQALPELTNKNEGDAGKKRGKQDQPQDASAA